MHPFMRSPRRLLGVAAVLAAVLTAAACSTESGEGTQTGSDDAVSEQATTELEALFGDGTFALPPDSGPAAQPDARVAIVNSGVQSPTGTKQAEAATEAAELLGWDLSIYDGKYEPAAYQEGIRRAIASNADVIWLFSIDCPLVKNALEEAKQAGIPVVSQEAADCSDVDPNSESYFARTLEFQEGNFVEWAEALGASQAVWLLSRLGEEANIIEFSVPELIITKAISDGFQAKMEEMCPTCPVETVEVKTAEFGPPLQQKFETALLRNPDANGISVSYDDLMTTGGAAAVMSSGRNDSLEVVAGSGFPANVDLIHKNEGQDAGFGYDAGIETWAAADMVNRLLAGEETVPSGVGVAVFDGENGLPPEGTQWETSLDYQSIYKEVWGVS